MLRILILVYTYVLCCSVSDGWEQSPVPFPPEIEPPDENGIVGHLKPFGHQRPPEGPVIEYDTVLHPREFWEKHVSKRLPLVFRRAVLESAAYRLWTDEYLAANYGDNLVLYEKRQEDRKQAAKKMPLQDFIRAYKNEEKNIYAVTLIPEDMRKDVQVLPCLLCGTFSKFLQESNFWMGYGGTRSIIHYDADNILHCLVAGGKKNWMLIANEHKDKLYMAGGSKFQGSGFSLLNPDKIDMHAQPKVADVPWLWTTLEPGDCVFVPAAHLHQVRSYGRVISATVLFTPLPYFNDTGCDNASFGYTDLSQVHLHWTYKKGDKEIDMGYMNPEQLRYDLRLMLNEDKILTKKAFDDLIAFGTEVKEVSPESIFKSLDIYGRGYLTEEDINTLPAELLKTMAKAIDPPHGEDDDEFSDDPDDDAGGTVLDGKHAEL